MMVMMFSVFLSSFSINLLAFNHNFSPFKIFSPYVYIYLEHFFSLFEANYCNSTESPKKSTLHNLSVYRIIELIVLHLYFARIHDESVKAFDSSLFTCWKALDDLDEESLHEFSAVGTNVQEVRMQLDGIQVNPGREIFGWRSWRERQKRETYAQKSLIFNECGLCNSEYKTNYVLKMLRERV